MERTDQAWAGIDVGKARHHVAVVDDQGRTLYSETFADDEAVIALARRRVDALWALLRDNRIFTPDPPGARA